MNIPQEQLARLFRSMSSALEKSSTLILSRQPAEFNEAMRAAGNSNRAAFEDWLFGASLGTAAGMILGFAIALEREIHSPDELEELLSEWNSVGAAILAEKETQP